MFILALVFKNSHNILRANYPANAEGNVCAYETAEDGELYPYMYFSDINDPINNRHCLNDCPENGVEPECGFG